MSQSRTVEEETDDDPKPHADVERIARANGWKPRTEFKGDPDKWKPADQFVAYGLENPAILEDRNKVLAHRLERLERVHGETVGGLKKDLDDTRSTLGTMTEMMRKAEERAYLRAKRDLKQDMERAVETADTATFKQKQAELDDLEKAAPTAAPPPTTRTDPPPQQQQQQLDPAAKKFYDENPWYPPGPQHDLEMAAFADGIFNAIKAGRPDLGTEEYLKHVTREVKGRFPNKFGRQVTQQNNDDDNGGNRRNRNPDPDDDDDRAPDVTPSSGSPAPRRNTNRKNFDSMPSDSKAAYNKYAKQIESLREQKGEQIKPLTKEEWAATYYEQDGT